jgi:hypothetical protein
MAATLIALSVGRSVLPKNIFISASDILFLLEAEAEA